MKVHKLWVVLMTLACFFACKKDDKVDPELKIPVIDKVEVGLSDNGLGIIGRDFHFNAEILAGERIEFVKISIRQRNTEVYAKPWSFDIVWDQFKDARNATVHKHFDIPEDAAEGKYDFIIIVQDQNGSILEEKREIIIYKPENLPVDPKVHTLNIFANGETFYKENKFSVNNPTLSANDVISSQAIISDVKGEGIMYLLLINKKHNHKPESIDKIDFSKVIVYDVYEHNKWEEGDFFSNVVFDISTFSWLRQAPLFKIGSETDNNVPPSPITVNKLWESGNYYFGVVYQNTTYNTGIYQYTEFKIQYP